MPFPAFWAPNYHANTSGNYRIDVKVHMKSIFSLHNFTIQYVNKPIVKVEVLLNKNLVMFLAQKTAQFLSKNGQEAGTSFVVQIHLVTWCCGQN